MKKIAIVVALLTLATAALINAAEPVTVGRDRAEAVNSFIHGAISPLLSCFSTNWSAARTVPDSMGAQRIYSNLRQCSTMAVTSRTMPAPEPEGESIRSAVMGLLQKLESRVQRLQGLLQQHEQAQNEKVSVEHLVDGNNPVYKIEGSEKARVYPQDPRKRFENDISNERIEISNLGTEYESIRNRTEAWTRRVQAEINDSARQQQGR
jgi:hypothetical protein